MPMPQPADPLHDDHDAAASTATPTDTTKTVALMGAVAASLVVMSVLHLSGVIQGGSKPYRPGGAGIAEAVIAVVLATGAFALRRAPGRARRLALGATGFAIAGFLVGLSFTLRGGSPVDIAYHLTGLPVLLITLAFLLRRRAPA